MAKQRTNTNKTGTEATHKKEAFLKSYKVTGNVTLSARDIKVHRSTIYKWLESDHNFKEKYENAQQEALDLIEQEAIRRATTGVEKIKFYKGKPIMVPVLKDDGTPVLDKNNNPVMRPYTEHEYSDTLMIFMLKSLRPEKYRERSSVDLTSDGDKLEPVVFYLPDNGRNSKD